MAGVKALAKETAIYGLSSIVGRFLNWCLVPLYVYIFPTQEYGVVSYLYSFTAVALVILNYGMETGFFRFTSRSDNPERVYTTSLLSVGTTSLLFIAALCVSAPELSEAIHIGSHTDYLMMLGITVGIDAFSNIPFAYLRYKKRALRFAAIKLANVGVNIALNLFFLILCPKIEQTAPWAIDWFYSLPGGESFGIGWIFMANILSTLMVLLLLLPEIVRRRYEFDSKLLRSMLSYSWPLLILGIAGIMSQNMGQMIIPFLFSDQQAAQSMVGIYGANIKIAIVMVMFTQAFRYAYEPFIFAQSTSKSGDKTRAYCDAMKFFVIFALIIFMAVMFYIDIIKYFVSPQYRQGLVVVPVMMAAELFFGIFFNLSLWYKLTDRTRWGMYFSLFGFVVMLGLNLWLVPAIGIPDGYIGSALAALISYFLMMTASYIAGRHYYPLPYEVKRLSLYCLAAGAVTAAGMAIPSTMPLLCYPVRTALLLLSLVAIAKIEHLPLPRKQTK